MVERIDKLPLFLLQVFELDQTLLAFKTHDVFFSLVIQCVFRNSY